MTELVLIETRHKFGYENKDGKIIIEPQFEEAKSFIGSYAIVKNNGKYGVIDIEGKFVINCLYNEIKHLFSDVFAVKKNEENDDWNFGVIDIRGKIILNFEHKYIECHNEQIFHCFSLEGKYDYLFNTKNKENVIKILQNEKWINLQNEVIFEGEGKFLDCNLLAVKKNDKWGVIDFGGKRIVNFSYDNISCIKDTLVVVNNNNVGLLGKQGEFIIEPSYKSIECVNVEDKISDSEPIYRDRSFGDFYAVFENLYHSYREDYIFDTNTSLVKLEGEITDKFYRSKIKLINNSIVFEHPEGFDFSKYLILSTDDYSEIYIQGEGIISNSKYEEVTQITNEAFVVKNNIFFGIYKADSKSEIIPCEFDRVQFQGTDLVLLCKNGLWGAQGIIDYGIFNIVMEVKIPFEFLEIKILNLSGSLFGVKKEVDYYGEVKSEYTILNQKGDPYGLIGKWESQFTYYNEDKIITSSGGKYGFVSKNGYVSIPFKYDEIKLRPDNDFDIRIDNRWGILTLDGLEKVAIKYSERIPTKYSKIIVEDSFSGCFGILSVDGKEIVPTIHQNLFIDDDYVYFGYGGYVDDGNFFSDYSNSTWGCMTKDGKIIVPRKYDCFKHEFGFILAGRDGYMLHDDYDGENNYGSEYSGVYDLYDNNGDLIFGGFSKFQYDNKNGVYIFLLGAKWETYSEIINEWNDIRSYHYKFNSEKALWLFLDKNLNTIIRTENGEQHKFNKGFICTIDIKKDENKIIRYFNLPVNLLAHGFKEVSGSNIIIGNSNNNDFRLLQAINIATGIKTDFYQNIQFINNKIFFFQKNWKMGIASFEQDIIEPKYLCLTEPINGFCFGIFELDKKFSSVELLNINEKLINPIIAISNIDTKHIANNVFIGHLKISLPETSYDLSDISVPVHEFFDDSFLNIISPVKSELFYGGDKNIYWFSGDYRF